MSNISREEDLQDLEYRMAHNGNREAGSVSPPMKRAEAYNAVHGTSFSDDDSLDRYLSNRPSTSSPDVS